MPIRHGHHIQILSDHLPPGDALLFTALPFLSRHTPHHRADGFLHPHTHTYAPSRMVFIYCHLWKVCHDSHHISVGHHSHKAKSTCTHNRVYASCIDAEKCTYAPCVHSLMLTQCTSRVLGMRPGHSIHPLRPLVCVGIAHSLQTLSWFASRRPACGSHACIALNISSSLVSLIALLGALPWFVRRVHCPPYTNIQSMPLAVGLLRACSFTNLPICGHSP